MTGKALNLSGRCAMTRGVTIRGGSNSISSKPLT